MTGSHVSKSPVYHAPKRSAALSRSGFSQTGNRNLQLLAPNDPHQPSYGFDVWIIVLGAVILVEIIILVAMG